MITRSKIFVSVIISALIAFMPITFCVSEYNRSINFELNTAYASDGTALDFLGEMANAAGLTTDDLIATVANCTTIGIGLKIANSLGIDYGKSNLDSLIDAADFPAWDTLSESEQASWGSVDNYYSAKFNSLMHAFGMKEADERFTGSGGASGFTFTERELDLLSRLGSIGNNWKNGIANSYGDVVSTITNRNDALTWTNQTNYQFSPSNGQSWPSNVPYPVNLSRGKSCHVYSSGTNYYVKTSADCYYFLWQGSATNFQYLVFEKYAFQYGLAFSPNDSVSVNSSSVGSASKPAYKGDGNFPVSSGFTVDMANNGVLGTLNNTAKNQIVNAVLYGTMSAEPNLEGYPEEIPDEQETYFPDEGLSPDTTWTIIITPSSGSSGTVDLSQIIALLNRFNFTGSGDLRVHDSEILTAIENCCNRFTFYTTGQLKVHDEGIFDQLTDVQTTLNQILAKIGLNADAPDIIGEFDYPELQAKSNTLVEDISTLAPFGSMLVISETIGILSQTEQITEPKLDVPFKFGLNQDYSVEIDLSWLDPLKPLINALLIMVLVMTLAGVTLRFVELEASA